MTKIKQLDEYLYLITGENFHCGLENKDVKLGLICEILNLQDIDAKYDDELYPFIVECSIVPLEYGKKFKADVKKCSGGDKIYDWVSESYRYAGGVSVAMYSIKGENKTTADYEMRTQKHATFENEIIKIPYFRTAEDAELYIKDVYSKNCIALFGMIGFYLDNPVNRAGWTGWDIIEQQVNDKELKF